MFEDSDLIAPASWGASWRRRRGQDEEDGGIRDDAFIEVETELRKRLIDQSQAMVQMLAGCITKKNAPRALRLIEQVAENQRRLLSSIMLAGEGPLRARRGTVAYGVDPETYGANAIEQMASTMGAAMGPSKEAKTRDLLSAIKHAKDAEEPELAEELKVELDTLMHPPEPVDEPGDGFVDEEKEEGALAGVSAEKYNEVCDALTAAGTTGISREELQEKTTLDATMLDDVLTDLMTEGQVMRAGLQWHWVNPVNDLGQLNVVYVGIPMEDAGDVVAQPVNICSTCKNAPDDCFLDNEETCQSYEAIPGAQDVVESASEEAGTT